MKEETTHEQVNFKTIVKLDSKLKPGQEVVDSEGVVGQKNCSE